MRAYNETLYDKDMIIRYNKYYLADFFKRNFSIIAVGAAAAATYSFAVSQWSTGLLIIGMIVAYAIMTVIIQKTSEKKALKNSPIVENPIIRSYLFDDQQILVNGRFVTPQDVDPGVVRPKDRVIKYEEIVRIQTKADFMMIYDTEKRTYLVNLASFETPEQYQELKPFLAAKLGKRYH